MSTPEVRSRGTRLPRNARRSQLLGAAREVFVAQGYHAAAMDEIAERAGVSKPVLYQHFPGKRDLYLALVDQHAGEVVESIRAGLAGSGADAADPGGGLGSLSGSSGSSGAPSNKQRAAAAISAFFEFIDRENESFRLIFESDLTSDPEVRERIEAVNEQTGQMIAALLQEESGLPAEQCELLGMGLSGMASVAARYWLQKGRPMPREEAARLVAALAWRGVGGFPRVGDDPSAAAEGGGRAVGATGTAEAAAPAAAGVAAPAAAAGAAAAGAPAAAAAAEEPDAEAAGAVREAAGRIPRPSDRLADLTETAERAGARYGR